MPDTNGASLILPGGPPKQEPKADPNAPVPVATAFLVIVKNDGQVVFERDINKPVVPARQAHRDEIRSALHGLGAKMAAEDSANYTLMKIQQQAQAQQRAMEEAMLRAALEQQSQQGQRG